MAKWLVERRLTGVSSKLRAARAELEQIDEQVRHFADEADDLRLRAMVSEQPFDGREHRDAQRHADAMAEHRARLVRTIAELEQRQDALLDELMA